MTLEIRRIPGFSDAGIRSKRLKIAQFVEQGRTGSRTVANATELVPYTGLATLVLRHDFPDKNLETITKLLTATIRFSRWIDDKPAAARSAMAKNLVLPDDLAAKNSGSSLSDRGLTRRSLITTNLP